MAQEDNANRPEILDLDEPEPQERHVREDGAPPPDWDPSEPMMIGVDGRIHIHGGRFFSSRVVGRVGSETAQETIKGLIERFQELEDRFKVLRRELKGSHNLVRSLKSAQSFVHWVEGSDAIGDFPGLLERAYAMKDSIETKLEKSRITKIALIEKAESIADSTSWSATSKTMEEIMDEWKHAGSGGGDEDDVLWERFHEARSRFYTHKSEHHSELRQSRADARKKKEELTGRSAALADSTDWDPTSDAMQALMDEWKLAGSAGRKADDELWEKFRNAREPFFAARREHFKKQQASRPARGANRDRRDRRDHGNRPQPRAPGRTRSTGTLHASLAEILGPMKDLYPDKNSKPDASEAKSKKKR